VPGCQKLQNWLNPVWYSVLHTLWLCPYGNSGRQMVKVKSEGRGGR